MAQNKIVTDIEFNISKALKSIQALRTSLSGKIDIIGVSAVQKAESGLHQIEQQIVKLQQKAPGIGATAQEFDKFYKETLKVTNGMDKLLGEFQGFQVTDDYLKENISALQQLSQEAIEASKRTKELKENIASTPISSYETKGQKQKSQQTERQMREYALQGDTEKIKETYAARGAEYKTLISDAKSSGDAGRVKTLIKDRNQLIAIEQKYLALARQVTVATQEEGVQATNLRTALDNAFEPATQDLNELNNDLAQASSNLHQVQNSSYQANQEMLQVEKSTKAFGQLSDQITHLFSATSIFYMLRRVVRGAIQDFQELDKQFNEIAIVSDYSTSEMWKSFSTVNKTAQEFGVTTKNVLEVQNLYYHQGKDMAEVNKLTAQTLTLAKITGMDYERATSDLTAALNAYNIAAEDAVRVTDTIAAMDTNAAISSEELMTALTKTASIAANAGMSLESTEVFLTKMIETTREAPENLGTALKTIIARFGEVKQEIDGEEIELADINRVDTALKSIGISLLDTVGQIRDLDGVFMELSSKWDDLDRNTQRYIATIAAGSRQQSRFIAMMEDYDRTLELTEIAQNSAGLGAKQLAKAQESIETSVNRLKSSWQEFYQNIIKSGAIKTVLDTANTFLSVLNALPGPLGAVAAGVALWALKTKVLDKVLLTHKIINDGLVKGLTQQQITQNLLTALTQKRSSTLKEYLAVLKLYQIEQAKSAVTEAVKTKAIDENTQEQINNALAIAAREKIEDAAEADSAKDILIRAAENEALEENTRQLLKNTAAQLGNNIAKSNGNKKGITSILSTLFGKGGKLGQFLTQAGGFLVKAGPWIATITAAIVALTAVYKKFIKASIDDTKATEELEKARENYNKSLNEYNDLLKNAEIVEKHRHSNFKSAEDLAEEQEAIKALVEEYPNLLESIDDEGNYHIKNAEAIEREIAAKKELTETSLKTYSALRVQYAKQGIYADESTLAGQSMANLKQYYSVLDKDAIKDLAASVDKLGAFNSTLFKQFAEAYASGEKTSFGYKDFNNLFGQVFLSQQEFNTLVEKYNEQLSQNASIEQAIKASLSEVGITNNQQIADMWLELNKQTGDMYSNLLSGIGQEVNEIYVQEAEMYVENALGDTTVEQEVQSALQKAYARTKGTEIAKQEQQRQDIAMDNMQIAASSAPLNSFGQIDPSVQSAYAAAAYWGTQLAISDEEINEKATENAEQYINSITEALKNSENVEKVNKAFREFGAKIYGENIDIDTGNKDLDAFLLEEWNYQVEEIDNIVEKINLAREEFFSNVKNEADNYSWLSIEDLELTHDQIKRVEEIYEQLGEQGGNRFLEGYYKIINSDSFSQMSEDYQNAISKLYLNIDPTNVDAVGKAIYEMGEYGLKTENILQDLVNAAGGLDAFNFGDVTSSAERAEKQIESLASSIESLIELSTGSGNLSAVATLFDSITKLAVKNGEDVAKALETARGQISYTSEGIAYGGTGATDSAKRLVELQQATLMIEMQILQGKIDELLALQKIGQLDAEQNALLNSYLAQQEFNRVLYGEYEATYLRTFNDKATKQLEEQLEKLEAIRDAIKDIVTWLREYERYADLDAIIGDLEHDFDDLEFEINFSTNIDVVEKDMEKSLQNINNQIAANQGGLLAAESEKEMYRNILSNQNSKYVDFDAEGHLLTNQEELYKLQLEIERLKRNNQEERAEVLENEYEQIMANIEGYREAEEKVNSYSDALKDNFNELNDFLDGVYDSVVKLEDKLIETRMATEDKELEAVKDKYDAIKEENDKYLESIQRMVDEERRIRDRADREQDVKDKEKKLAMMKMDTSGVYATDIRALEKELEGDYRDLEDEAVDEAIRQLEEQSDAQAEALDKEIEYMENTLEYKREIMTEYNDWANNLIKSGSDEVIAYLKANDEEYTTATVAKQKQIESEWNTTITQGIAANELMGTSLMKDIYDNLENCKQNANSFEEAVQQYSESVVVNNGEVSGSIENLTGYYESLVDEVGNLQSKISQLSGAYYNAADAAMALAQAQAYTINASPYTGDIEGIDDSSTTQNANKSYNEYMRRGSKQYTNNYTTDARWTVVGDIEQIGNGQFVKIQSASGEEAYARVTEKGDYNTLSIEEAKKKGQKTPFGANLSLYWKYAKGGYVDYTGPAWVDGTKSHPEYMLNATQTQQFETLVAALSSMFANGNTPISQTSQKIGDAVYNFHINVDQMSSDYDVDQLIDRIEKRLIKAGQYRNVTMVKKTK